MANNRMYLVHIPTGLAVMIGKRLGWGWYMHPESQSDLGNRIALLYEVLEKEYSYEGNQDDFTIALEDADEASFALGNLVYGPERKDKLIQLIIKDYIDGDYINVKENQIKFLEDEK